MSTKKTTLLITAGIIAVAALWVTASVMSSFKMVELDEADIVLYIDELSVSDVYSFPDSDYYFFIVWAGKKQEGYYIHFDNEVLSLPMKPRTKKITSTKVMVRESVSSEISTEADLVADFEWRNGNVVVDVKGMHDNTPFDTKPLLCGKKLEFLFKE